ncbi:MAG: hypothetical protein V3T08_09845 [Gemmatimonadota bacterium]
MTRHFLTGDELCDAAAKNLEDFGGDAHLTLVFPGKRLGISTRRRRLHGPGSPLGRPLSESPLGGLVVSFRARDVVDWCLGN